MQIAIDGPAGAGKSTVAKAIAKELGYNYIDTGAMYRALTLKGLHAGYEIREDDPELLETVLNSDIDFRDDSIYLDGEDVTDLIRGEDVTANVSCLSSIKEVREKLVELQRRIAERSSVVMDGRDIGSVVLPDAELKIYLDASPLCRAKRRAEETGIKDHDEVLRLKEKIELRDHLDSTREYSPLIRAEDAHYLLTDELTVPEVVDTILEISEEKR